MHATYRRSPPFRGVDAVGLGLASALTLVQPAAARPKAFMELGFISGWSGAPVAEVSNVPEAVRYVPTHPDDKGLWQDAIPVRDKPLSPYAALHWVSGRFGFRWPDEADRYSLAFGLEAVTLNSTRRESFNRRRDLAEANYGSDEGPVRGEGTALTYYSIDSDYPLGGRWAAFLEVRGGRSPGNSLGLGLAAYPVTVRAEQGWDRYNRLEVRREFTLAHLLGFNAYATGRRRLGAFGEDVLYVACDGGLVGAGASRTTDTGRGVHVRSNWTWFLTFRLGTEF